jgi:hypothetical protein
MFKKRYEGIAQRNKIIIKKMRVLLEPSVEICIK